MSPPTYLKQRRKGWYVQVPVPRSRQEALGCKTIERTLRTRDKDEALKLRFRVVADIQAIIEGTPEAATAGTPEAILDTARRALAAVNSGATLRRDAEAALDAAVEDYLEAKARSLGVDEEGSPELPAAATDTIRRAYRTLSGDIEITLGFQAARYLARLENSSLRLQTIGDKRRHLEAFLDWAGRDTECKKVGKRMAAAYVDEVVAPRKLAPHTKRLAVNVVHQFFDWLEARDLADMNPFAKAGKLLKDSKRGNDQARRPWTNEELLAVLQHIPQDDPMWPMVALGAYTGARREDICGLRVESVDGDTLVIREGKTAAAVRRVPVHPVIKPLVDRLKSTSTDGYLLPGLLTGGDDSKRGHYIGKRFSYAKDKAGVSDSRVVFHSFRNSVLSQMDAAGVELSLRQQIVGHARSTLTERVYTAGAADDRRAAALAHVTYGDAVDSLVRRAGAALKVDHVSRRRR